MNKTNRIALAVVPVLWFLLAGFSGPTADTDQFELSVIPGSEWIHAFSFLVRNPPQYAVWLEDESGRFIETLYVTEKTGRAGWVMNKGNPRIESLPVWVHRRRSGDRQQDLMPTKKNPVADSETGATPRSGQVLPFSVPAGTIKYWIFLEVNHSTDFNEFWPKKARPGERGWSGGKEGSGQPSLVYRVLFDPREPGPWSLTLVGHGRADGSDGSIHPDLAGITTARLIVKTPVLVKREATGSSQK